METDKSPLQCIQEKYNDLLKLSFDDKMMVDALFATHTANMHPKLSEPVWMQFIAPPGANKTEALRPFIGAPDIVFVSSLTENALISGYTDEEGTDPSLITKLNGKILVWKDMSTLCSDNPAKVAKIFGDLRDAFDGFCSKPSGRAGLRSYTAKFGVIGAVTPSIDYFSEEHQQLGERFLSFRLYRYPRKHHAAVDFLTYIMNIEDKSALRTELRETVHANLQRIKQAYLDDPYQPVVPDEIGRKIATTSHILSQIRATPIKSGDPVEPEVATRLVQQLTNIAKARAFTDNRRELNEEDVSLINRIAIDTLTILRRRAIMLLYSEGRCPKVSISQIRNKTRCPVKNIQGMISQFLYTKLISESNTGRGRDPLYQITPDFKELLDSSSLFEIGTHLPKRTSVRS